MGLATMRAVLRLSPLMVAMSFAGHAAADDDALLTAKQMRTLHTRLDENGDGQVSLKEILDYSLAMTRDVAARETEDILHDMDRSKDGAISFDEHLRDLSIDPEGPKVEATEAVKRHEASKFKVADANGDGLLHKDELVGLMFPHTHDAIMDIEAKEVLRKRDANGDGRLSLQEFGTSDDILSEAHWAEQFKKADADGDGFLSLEEVRHWEAGHVETEHAMKTLMASADKDGDGHLSADELADARGLISSGTDDEAAAVHYFLRWIEHHEL